MSQNKFNFMCQKKNLLENKAADPICEEKMHAVL